MAAGSSTDPLEDDADLSIALAIQLQQEEDAALAQALMAEEMQATGPSAAAGASQRNTGAAAHDTNAPPRGKLPGELLAGPAYKAVAHLGRKILGLEQWTSGLPRRDQCPAL